MGQSTRRLNRQRAIVRQSLAPMIEPLARRMMLSASVSSAGILKIIGSESRDRIVVSADLTFVNVLDVSVNSMTRVFSLSDIRRISIRGKGGNDVIRIEASLDSMHFPVVIDAGAGNDRISSGAGDDTIVGGGGNDRIYGNAGNDKIDGGAGRDIIYAGDDNDSLSSGGGNDVLYGAAGNDRIDGGTGNDRLNGGDGNDTLSDNAGRDTVNCGAGDDTGTFKDAGKISGGAGNDTITSGGRAQLIGDAGDDQLTGANVFGGDGNDTLRGTGGADHLLGGNGDDLIRGMGGNDAAMGDAGNDAIFGGAGTDTLHGGDGNDNLYGDDGANTATVASTTKRYDAGSDIAFGDAGVDWFEPTYKWQKIDGNARDAEANKGQNQLSQDSSLNAYGASSFNSSSVLVRYTYAGDANITNNVDLTDFSFLAANFNQTGSSGWSSGDFNYDGHVDLTDFSMLANNFNQGIATASFTSLGAAGWISSGVHDSVKKTDLPGELSDSQRQQVQRTALVLPQGWELGTFQSAGQDLLWYSLTGGTGKFLAVKRGTILISDSGENLLDPKSFSLQSALMPLPSQGEVRIAGSDDVYHLGGSFIARVLTVPAGARGILVKEGAIVLPQDGTAPSFTNN